MPTQALLYSRDLPGGGFVAIDVRTSDGPAAAGSAAAGSGEALIAGSGAREHHAQEHHARLWVERRADPARRAGHTPPVIARAESHDLEHAVAELRVIAADNVALALAMRRWARGPAAS